jgi:Ser/Thr protein kinase RdoA (MazF antagonist)
MTMADTLRKRKVFKVMYSVADADAVGKEVGGRYGFGGAIDCRFYRSGFNDVYRIKAGDKVYYLRIANSGRVGYSLADYEEEAALLLSLSENGVNTATPVPCLDGKYLWALDMPEGERYAILLNEARKEPSKDKKEQNYQFGRMLAKLHTVSDEKGYEVSREPLGYGKLVKRPLELIKPYMGETSDDYAFIRENIEKMWEYVTERIPKEKPYYGFCHGDAHMGNAHFVGDEPTMFDFDCMGYGWRAYDASAHTFWDMERKNQQYRESEEYKAYIDGYNSVRKLTENELECFGAFGAIRYLWMVSFNITALEKMGGTMHIDAFNKNFIKVFKDAAKRILLDSH